MRELMSNGNTAKFLVIVKEHTADYLLYQRSTNRSLL